MPETNAKADKKTKAPFSETKKKKNSTPLLLLMRKRKCYARVTADHTLDRKNNGLMLFRRKIQRNWKCFTK